MYAAPGGDKWFNSLQSLSTSHRGGNRSDTVSGVSQGWIHGWYVPHTSSFSLASESDRLPSPIASLNLVVCFCFLAIQASISFMLMLTIGSEDIPAKWQWARPGFNASTSFFNNAETTWPTLLSSLLVEWAVVVTGVCGSRSNVSTRSCADTDHADLWIDC